METIFLLTAALITLIALDFGEVSARAPRRPTALTPALPTRPHDEA